jgi:hypothetical protein
MNKMRSIRTSLKRKRSTSPATNMSTPTMVRDAIDGVDVRNPD